MFIVSHLNGSHGLQPQLRQTRTLKICSGNHGAPVSVSLRPSRRFVSSIQRFAPKVDFRSARRAFWTSASTDGNGNGASAADPDFSANGFGAEGQVSSSVEDLKTDLLLVIAGTDRGQFASEKEKSRILSLSEQLGRLSPTEEPTTSPALDGRWKLLYSSRPLSKLSPLLALGSTPVLSIGEVFQTINVLDGSFINQVQVDIFPQIQASVATSGRCSVASPTEISIQIQSSKISPRSAFGFNTSTLPPVVLPIDQISQTLRGRTPSGTLILLYLDDDMRITTSSRGELTIFSRA